MTRRLLVAALFVLAGCKKDPAQLLDIGPRVVSNQTSQPLTLVGSGFRAGMELEVGAPFNRRLPVKVVDERHAYARLPADLTFDAMSEAVVVPVGFGGSTVRIRVVNDAAFPDPQALKVIGDSAFVISVTTDTLYRVADGLVHRLPAGDGPSALATDGARLVIAHAWEPSLWVCSAVTGEREAMVPAPAYATGVALAGDVVFVAEHATDTVQALDIKTGAVGWTAKVDPNPKSVVVDGDTVIVGSTQTGRVQLLDAKTGAVRSSIEPTAQTTIVGGHTAPYGQYIMGGKAVRDLAVTASRIFVSSIGPNIGPNPDKMEVSMNAGVGVIDRYSGQFTKHIAFGFGVTQGFALDETKGLLYVADIGSGLLRAFDTDSLKQQWFLPIDAPKNFPLTRAIADFGVNERSGVELHSGPQAVALSRDGARVFVLNRFSGTLAVVDARANKLLQQIPLDTQLVQRDRRLGQVLYFTDLGRTGMSCDACHIEGHDGGVLFEKTTPLRVYRTPTVRGTSETPPYFNPASTHSMTETNHKVGNRNRFGNPVQTPDEVKWLTMFANALTTLPNPFVLADGSPPEELTLPDGAKGHPLVGQKLFEGKADCARCHPAPYFTLDQDKATRNQFIDVGTPHMPPLHEEWQNPHYEGIGTPALIGTWDVWPQLTSGLAGLEVRDNGMTPNERFALRKVVDDYGKPPHGNAAGLTADERNDLLAYLLTL